MVSADLTNRKTKQFLQTGEEWIAMEVEQLFQDVRSELNLDQMIAHVEEMNRWHRYTGTPQAEQFVDNLVGKLKKAGIPYEIESYEAYTSLPLEAKLTLENGEKLRLIGDVFSAEAYNCEGKLVYDQWSEKNSGRNREDPERWEAFQNRLVLSWESGGKFAERVWQAGGKGILHISPTPGEYIHHSNIGSVWGTPCEPEEAFFGKIPSAGISQKDGIFLADRLAQGSVKGILLVRMESRVRKSRMPVVHIPGKRSEFILIHGHYDSWYEGITDNAGSDAILLELARAFWKHRDQLERSVRIAWWSGHSDARYAGSTWYFDHHGQELQGLCVASINLDLTGCKCARQIRARTAGMEGEALTAGLIREFTGMEAKPWIPMIRGADQSFWGAQIPIHIMFKYEPVEEARVSPCPSGGPWWHTDQDTLDKLDPEILLRDAKLNGKLACMLLNSRVLPVKLTAFVDWMRECLKTIQVDFAEDFSLDTVDSSLDMLRPWCEKLEKALSFMEPAASDRLLKRTAGELVRLVYTQGSPYQQDPAVSYTPFGNLARVKGHNRKNTPQPSYLFLQTEFQRACNRLIGQIAVVAQEIQHSL